MPAILTTFNLIRIAGMARSYGNYYRRIFCRQKLPVDLLCGHVS